MNISRRDLLKAAEQPSLAMSSAPLATAFVAAALGAQKAAVCCINVVNFIRGIEPRFPMDMMLSVQEQMKLLQHKLPRRRSQNHCKRMDGDREKSWPDTAFVSTFIMLVTD